MFCFCRCSVGPDKLRFRDSEGSVSSFGEEGEAAQEVDSESPVFSFTTEHEDSSCSKDSNLFKWVFSRRVFKTYDELQNVRC